MADDFYDACVTRYTSGSVLLGSHYYISQSSQLSFALRREDFLDIFTSWMFSCMGPCIRVISSNHNTHSVLVCLEVSSSNEISLQLLNLASGRFLRQIEAYANFNQGGTQVLSKVGK